MRLYPLIRDLSGRSFGRLAVVAYSRSAHGHAYWRCRCECGAEPEVRGTRLVTGRIVSCGCWRADHDIRQAARMKVSARRRRSIAKAGARARAERRLA